MRFITNLLIIIIFIFSLAGVNLYAQNAYHDAIFLKLFEGEKEVNYNDILKVFKKAELFISDPWENKLTLSDIKKLRKKYDKLKGTPRYEFTSISDKIGSEKIIKKAGFFNKSFQSNLIDAMGTFMAERFKEDITELYLNKFKGKLLDGELGGKLKILLPKTHALLKSNPPFNYLSLSNEFKISFKSDMDEILLNVIKYLKSVPGLEEKDIFQYLELAGLIGDKIIHGSHPVEILNSIEIKYLSDEDPIKKKIYNIAHLLNLIQFNFQNSQKEKDQLSWIKFSELNEIIDIDELKKPKSSKLNYFLALIYWQDELLFNNLKLGSSNGGLTKNKLLSVLNNKILPFYQLLLKIKEFDFKSNSTAEDYEKYMQFTIDLIKESIKIVNPDIKVEFLGIMQNTLDIYKTIYKKEYSHLFFKIVQILNEIKLNIDDKYRAIYKIRKKSLQYNIISKREEFKFNKEYVKSSIKSSFEKKKAHLEKEKNSYLKSILKKQNCLKKIEEIDIILESINKIDFSNLVDIGDQVKKIEFQLSLSRIIEVFSKYGAFIQGIAQAKDPQEIKKVIESIVLPKGSYLKKREMSCLTISAHPGIYLGNERDKITFNSVNKELHEGSSWGITAPIGLEWTILSKGGTSIGLFLSIVDIGAVFSYRLSNSGDITEPASEGADQNQDEEQSEDTNFSGLPKEVSIKQIFSPGLSLNIGLKNSPITFRVGVQYTPELRKIIENDVIMSEKKFWRMYIGISWDMPLFSLSPRFRK